MKKRDMAMSHRQSKDCVFCLFNNAGKAASDPSPETVLVAHGGNSC